MKAPGPITGVEDLKRWKEEGLRSISPEVVKVTVGMATCGLASGAQSVFDALAEELGKASPEAVVAKTGCMGFCEMEPIVEVRHPGRPRVIYREMTGEKARKLVAGILDGDVNKQWALATVDESSNGSPPATIEGIPRLCDLPFYQKQKKITLARCGQIDPENLAEYIAAGGYSALWQAVRGKTSDEIIAEIERSGLRGRGGAGFPTGRKWRFTRGAAGDRKFVVCNADEGDPGAYMDRSLLEGDPFAILEGMTIGAYAIGAREGFIYVRDEYPLAIEKLEKAVVQAWACGLLGGNIMGTDFSFDVRLIRGGGAFVCGEETALIASIEGRPGEPRQRPPFPAEKGLWGKPTNINNVETWATVPWILAHGADEYGGLGTETSKGTKVFSVVGKINNTGLIEVPMGITLREIVYDIGDGIPGGKKFKAIQTGGPSGGCIPEELLDLPVDYESLTRAGAIMGSGGMIVMDEETCMVDVARYFLEFLKEESCGKCAPCREGIDRALEILQRICRGKGEEDDIQTLEAIGRMMQGFALCALGATASNPVLSTIRHFRDEYQAHIQDGRCPAGVCRELIRYRIDREKCNGCTLCVKVCPQQAITGEKKEAHVVNEARCVKCGMCYEVCKQGAIEKE
ncbi:MAG TPA: NADH-quinone oxidoreductase subunit NuoF [Thermoguttaceae bacterium]|nr:NADH-quinone oxidoreductase subunit NuoF [Thermoguttaceae bacterium]